MNGQYTILEQFLAKFAFFNDIAGIAKCQRIDGIKISRIDDILCELGLSN